MLGEWTCLVKGGYGQQTVTLVWIALERGLQHIERVPNTYAHSIDYRSQNISTLLRLYEAFQGQFLRFLLHK